MSPQMQTFFNAIERIITIATPFVLAYIAYRSIKKEKKDEIYRRLREENETLEKQIADTKQTERDKAVQNLQKDVQDLKENMDKVTENIEISEGVAEKMNCALNDLLKLNNVNLAYCQSLSCLITTIGEGLKDKNSDDKLARAIATHQQKERELFASIVKSSC